MTDIEKIKYAKSFIEKLANGINPIDDSEIPDGDVVNNVRLSRCFFYVSSLLDRLIAIEENPIEQPLAKPEKKAKKALAPLLIKSEDLADFEYSPYPISASVLAERINNAEAKDGMTKLTYRHINQWLIDLELLELVDVGEDKQRRRPTEAGKSVGIILEFRSGQRGSYAVVLYSETAQRFIVDNIEALSSVDISKKK